MSDSDRTKSRTRSPLTAAQQDLAARYLPLARSMAAPYKKGWPGAQEDFESAACLALVEAAESFDPSRNVRFSTFARHRIWGALRDVQRGLVALGWRCDTGKAPFVGPIWRDVERRGRVLGMSPDPPVGEDLEAVEQVEDWLKKLPERHAAACRQIYLHGKTQLEAAKIMGVCQSRLSYMHREAMSILDGTWEANVLAGEGASL